jgi:hypothetical protein
VARSGRTLNWLAGLAFAIAVGVSAPGAAPATHATYKERMNAICRTYTPTLHRVENDATRAEKAGDHKRWGRDVGMAVGISLLEIDRLLRVAVPQALEAEMARPIRLLRTTKVVGHSVLNSAHTTQAVLRALDQFAQISTRLDRSLDEVGLRDCGSNQ